MKVQVVTSFIILLMLSACTVGPNYEQPEFQTENWIKGKESEVVNVQWWTIFNDPVLQELIALVAKDNLDIHSAQARVLEVRALRCISRSALLPFIGTDLSASRSQQSLNDPRFIQAPGLNIPQTQSIYEAGFDASWEIDLFGGNRRALESASAQLESAEAFRRSLTLSAIAETARNYIEMRGHQKHLGLLKRNADLQEQTVSLVQASFNSGLSRELDVTRAQAQLANTQALIPPIEAEIRAASYRLAVLTGQQPGALYENLEQSKLLPTPEEVVPLGLKSDLLRRRPDIQVVERNLAATTADVGVAIAKLYPSFNLIGALGVLSSSTGSLLDAASETFLLSSFIHFPIFEGGRLRAQICAAEARNSQAAIAYEQTVLNALEQTEEILFRYAKEQETRAKLRQAVQSSAHSAQLSTELYEKGLTNFIDVLNSERDLLLTESSLVQSETRVLTNLIALYKALGGGWEIFEEENKHQLNF